MHEMKSPGEGELIWPIDQPLSFEEGVEELVKVECEVLDAAVLALLLGIERGRLEDLDAKGYVPNGRIYKGKKYWKLADIVAWHDAGRPSRDRIDGQVR